MKTNSTVEGLELNLHVGPMFWETLVQADSVTVAIEYEIEFGQPEIIRADPNDCQQGIGDSVRIYSVTTTAPMTFENTGMKLTIDTGTEIIQMLPKSMLEAEEERILASELASAAADRAEARCEARAA